MSQWTCRETVYFNCQTFLLTNKRITRILSYCKYSLSIDHKSITVKLKPGLTLSRTLSEGASFFIACFTMILVDNISSNKRGSTPLRTCINAWHLNNNDKQKVKKDSQHNYYPEKKTEGTSKLNLAKYYKLQGYKSRHAWLLRRQY